MKSHRDLNRELSYFDVRTTIPLTTGEFILGDRDYYEQSKQRLRNQPITDSAVRHNLKKSERMKRLKEKHSDNESAVRKFTGYALTYLANALALKQGLRLFTKQGLLSYSQDLKGGIII